MWLNKFLLILGIAILSTTPKMAMATTISNLSDEFSFNLVSFSQNQARGDEDCRPDRRDDNCYF